jgi:hypothetical protein
MNNSELWMFTIHAIIRTRKRKIAFWRHHSISGSTSTARFNYWQRISHRRRNNCHNQGGRICTYCLWGRIDCGPTFLWYDDLDESICPFETSFPLYIWQCSGEIWADWSTPVRALAHWNTGRNPNEKNSSYLSVLRVGCPCHVTQLISSTVENKTWQNADGRCEIPPNVIRPSIWRG